MNSEFSELRALIIDDSPTSRMTLSSVLRDVGIQQIKGVSGPQQARINLQDNQYDVILCEYHFAGDETGQDLLDEIRYTRMIPYRTVFFMVTGEATYDKVAEVVENAPDDYLLKPFKPLTLEDRLQKALNKKLALLPVYDKMEAGEYEAALAQCAGIVRRMEGHWLQAARVGAELCVHLERHDNARQFYDLAARAKGAPWAKFGLAQLSYLKGDVAQAKVSLEELVSGASAYADAYDLLARIHFEDGALGETLRALRLAVQATPTNLARLQRLGALAFYIGDGPEADAALAKAYRRGPGSRVFDLQTVMMLVFLGVDRGLQGKDLERLTTSLQFAADRDPDNPRLQRMIELAGICRLLVRKELLEVVGRLKGLESWLGEPDFDFEAARNLVSLLSRVASREVKLPDAAGWVEAAARRHCTSKTASDLLAGAARSMKEYVGIIEAEHHRVNQLANEAMSRLLKGDADGAVRQLTEVARRTLNARLFHLADSLSQKHRARLSAESIALIEQARDLRERHCPDGVQVALAGIAEDARTSRTLTAA